STGFDMFCICGFAFSRHTDVHEFGGFADAILDRARRDDYFAVLVDVKVGAPSPLAVMVEAFVGLVLVEMRPRLAVRANAPDFECCDGWHCTSPCVAAVPIDGGQKSHSTCSHLLSTPSSRPSASTSTCCWVTTLLRLPVRRTTKCCPSSSATRGLRAALSISPLSLSARLMRWVSARSDTGTVLCDGIAHLL